MSTPLAPLLLRRLAANLTDGLLLYRGR